MEWSQQFSIEKKKQRLQFRDGNENLWLEKRGLRMYNGWEKKCRRRVFDCWESLAERK